MSVPGHSIRSSRRSAAASRPAGAGGGTRGDATEQLGLGVEAPSLEAPRGAAVVGEDLLVGRLGRILYETAGRSDVLVEFFALHGERHVVSGTFTRDDFRASEVTLSGRVIQGKKGPIFRARGAWRGPQSQLAAELPPPAGTAALLAHVVKGFGPKTAATLVEKLGGPEAWVALTREPYRVAALVGLERAMGIQRQILALGLDRAEALAHLLGLNISYAYARRALDGWGSEALQVLREDPYRLTELDGVRFATADRIAAGSFHLLPSDARRVQALAVSVLRDAADNGHTSLALDEVVATMRDAGGLAAAGIDPVAVLGQVVQQGRLVFDMGDYYLPHFHRAEVRAAQAIAALSERAPRVVAHAAETDATLAGYTQDQRAAVAAGLREPILMILGRPGSGKTSIAREIVRLAQQHGESVTLAATTATAAERMTEAICAPSKIPGAAPVDTVPLAGTIHALVGMEWPGKPLPAGVVLIDEFSMTDLPLLARIVANAGPATRLVFLGDPNQLPPVVAGNATRDLRAQQIIPAVELRTVHRQEGASLLALNIELVHDGRMPFFHGQAVPPTVLQEYGYWPGAFTATPPAPAEGAANEGAAVGAADHAPSAEGAGHGTVRPLKLPAPARLLENCYFQMARSPAQGADRVVHAVQRFQKSRGLRRDQQPGGYDPLREIRVYTPMKKGFLGTWNLNRRLQAVLNPAPAGEVPVTATTRGATVRRLSAVRLPVVALAPTGTAALRAHVLAAGDPVVFAAADASLGVRQGATGVVVSVQPSGDVALRVGARTLVVGAPRVSTVLRTDFPLELRIGDPVVQTKNVAGRPLEGGKRTKVANGARGVLVAATEAGGAVVEFAAGRAARRVVYTAAQLGELALAYATTVHKGQGQEAPVSILAIHPSEHYTMLDKALLYVGMSRGTEQFLCVGVPQALHMCLGQAYGLARRTRLTERIRAERERLRAGAPGPTPATPVLAPVLPPTPAVPPSPAEAAAYAAGISDAGRVPDRSTRRALQSVLPSAATLGDPYGADAYRLPPPPPDAAAPRRR